MNLTSKRMLTLSLACSALALGAVAQTRWVADDFEEMNIGDRAVLYRQFVPANQMQNEFTNFVWKAQGGIDASTIESVDGLGTYTGERPLDVANPQEKVLKLETDGDTLSRYVKYDPVNDPRESGEIEQSIGSIPIPKNGASELWVDTLVKFMISEDDPEIEALPDIKVALYVNADSNLVVRHFPFNGEYFAGTPEFSVLEGTLIDPDQWYRLTIELGDLWWYDGAPAPHFTIYLNGNKLTHPLAVRSLGAEESPLLGSEENPGYIFFSNDGTISDFPLTQVAFRGSGYVDDLVVADYRTSFGEPSSLLFTLMYDANVINVTADGTPVASAATVPTGAKVLFDIADWYRLDEVTGADQYDAQTGEVTVSSAGKTVTISSKAIDAAAAAGLISGHEVDGDKLVAWAKANALGEGDVSDDDLKAFLLNVAPETEVDLMITSIVDNGDGTVTITVSPTAVLDLTEINGTLVVQTVAALGDEWSEPEEYEVVFDVNDGAEAVITIDNADGKFLKAVIK